MLGVALLLAVYGSRFDHSMPPPRYQTEEIRITILFMDEKKVERECGKGLPKPPPDQHYVACTKPSGLIIMPNSCHFTEQDYALDLCHEIGHLLGWEGDHPR